MKLGDKIDMLDGLLSKSEDILDENDNINNELVGKKNVLSRLKSIDSMFDDVVEKMIVTKDTAKSKNLNAFDYRIEKIMENLYKMESLIYDGSVVDGDEFLSTYDPNLLLFRLKRLSGSLDDIDVYIKDDQSGLAENILDDTFTYSSLTNDKLENGSLKEKDVNDALNRLDDINIALDDIHEKITDDVSEIDKDAINDKVDMLLEAADKVTQLIEKSEDNFESNISEMKWITKSIDGTFIFNIDMYMRSNSYSVFTAELLDSSNNKDFLILADKMFSAIKHDINHANTFASGKLKLHNIPNELEKSISDLIGEELFEKLTSKSNGLDAEENEEGDNNFNDGDFDSFDSGGDDFGDSDGFDDYDSDFEEGGGDDFESDDNYEDDFESDVDYE